MAPEMQPSTHFGLAQWRQAVGIPGKPQQLLVLIGEVKEITPARYGFKAVVKHVPDQAFTVDEQLYRRLGRRFERELALWGASDEIKMMMIATFTASNAGVPTIHELSLMPLTRQWIPIEKGSSKQLIDRLIAEGRSFIKGLRYNLARDDPIACAVLTDCGEAPVALNIAGEDDASDDRLIQPEDAATPTWVWRGTQEPMPELPERASARENRHSMPVAPCMTLPLATRDEEPHVAGISLGVQVLRAQ